MNHECFQVLHPWAYELDSVDFKYIVNNNLAEEICQKLSASVDAQVFWLSFFKPQKACAADEFIENLCRKMLSYALGRQLMLSDSSTIATMQEQLKANQYRFSALIETIVLSPQFRNHRGRQDATQKSP